MAAVVAPTSIAVFWAAGLYRGTWRLASLDDFVRAGKAIAAAVMVSALVITIAGRSAVPPSLFVIFGLLTLVLIVGARVSYRVLLQSKWRAAAHGSPTLIYGAGRNGVNAMLELLANPGRGLHPLGFIDDQADRTGKRLGGLPILGTVDSLDRTIDRLGIQSVVMSTAKISTRHFERALRTCRERGVTLLRMELRLDAAGDTEAPASSLPRIVTGVRRGLPAALDAVASCLKCNSTALHRSHIQSLAERARRVLTRKRPFRCAKCGWRGWLTPLEFAVGSQVATTARQAPDFAAVDAALSRAAISPTLVYSRRYPKSRPSAS
jgi:hypothetical protein